MNKSCLLGAVSAAVFALLLAGQVLAAGPGGHLTITEVFLDQPVDGQTTIKGEDLDFGKLLTVTLGDIGALTVVSETPMEIIVDMPAVLTPGDYLLTVSRGNGQSQNDEYDLTIVPEPETPDPGGPLDCPAGYTEVNDNYCIETNQNPGSPDTWMGANKTCIEANTRLCSSGEWVYACDNAVSLGLNSLPGLEWLGDLSNGGNANFLGAGAARPLCYGGSSALINSGGFNFRCCFDR